MDRPNLISVLALGFGLALATPLAVQAACEDQPPEQRLQNTAAQDIGRSLDQIREDGYIEFALYEDYRPWSWEEGGKPTGIDVDIAKLIAEDRNNFV